MREISKVGIASTCLLWSALILAGCTVKITGTAALPANNNVRHPVEWVTDPESDSTDMLAVTISADGEFAVGADFPPGRYFSEGSLPGSVCNWQRAKDQPSGLRTVAAAGTSVGPQFVVIEPTDSVFVTQSCRPWQLVK